ncbi:unnamed protein product [Sphagnum tenellum]
MTFDGRAPRILKNTFLFFVFLPRAFDPNSGNWNNLRQHFDRRIARIPRRIIAPFGVWDRANVGRISRVIEAASPTLIAAPPATTTTTTS